MPGGPVAAGGGVGIAEPKSKWPGIFMTVFAAFGGILFGYDTGTIGGLQATKDFLRTFGHPDPTNSTGFSITTSQQSLVVSILSVGTFFGALAAAPVADIVGRKLGIVLTTIVFSIGVAMQTAATSWGLFNAGRVFAGFGVGLVSCLIPMYQSECAPKWIRGAVVACYQWAVTIGLLLAAILSKVCEGRDNHSAYRIPIAIQFIWAAILAAGMLFLPESPRWLVKRGREDAAARSLSRLTGYAIEDPEVQQELEDIKINLKEELELGESGWLDCFKHTSNKILFRTLTGIALQAWQQLTGINFIFYYGTFFFKLSGISDPFLATIATNVVNVGMTVPGILAVDRVGRRRLLLIGAAGMLVCEYLVAIIGVTISVDNSSGQKALIGLVCIYIAFFASTWGPIAWIIIGEIFPLNVRAKGMALSTASNWLWNWAIAYATPFLVNVGPGDAGLQVKVFFIWGSTCVGCLLFTYFCIPETKGLSLEQVDILYQNTTPIKSVAYRKQLIANDIHAADPDSIAKIRGGGVLGRRDIEKGDVVDHDSADGKA